MSTFNAYRIDRTEDNNIVAEFQQISIDDLTDGEVVVKVAWSGINFKDVLAATGKGKILRRYPLVGGIDLSGTVVSSTDARYKQGDAVLVCGCGLSETADGGYAEYARVCSDCIVPLPAQISLRDAMALGTAGFTAAMAVMRMERNGQTPEHGAVVVTGATGGVGSIAIDILASKGYSVTAFTGKMAQRDYLSAIGANAFIDRHSIEMGVKPLESATWGGAVDNAGGATLAWLTRTVKPWGNIASIGLVDDFKLNTTVMPFILRGVSLLGINSIEMPNAMRNEIWKRMGEDLKANHLDKIVTNEVALADLPATFARYLDGTNIGRTIVRVGA